MTLSYGFVKAKMTSAPRLISKTVPHGGGQEKQYHLHFSLAVDGGNWDVAVNVGTDSYSHKMQELNSSRPCAMV